MCINYLIDLNIKSINIECTFGSVLNIYIYVTLNMCNQGIRVFPENFSEYAYSLNWSGNTCIP